MEKYKKIIAVVAAAIIIIVPVLLFTLPKKDFSENENRVLQDIPEYSIENLVSGQLSNEIENYVNDHFPLRDNLVAMKTYVQAAMGYKEMNGVFIARGRLLQHIDKPDASEFIERVNKLCENLRKTSVNMNLMVVPTSTEVYRELLPAHAPDVVEEQPIIEEIYDQVHCGTIDVLGALKEAKNDGENLYYNLDHHWSFYGAYVGYTQFCEKHNVLPGTMEDFEPVCVSTNFKGSLYSKVLLETMPADEILAPNLKNKYLVVTYCDKGTKENTYYDKNFLKQKDKYSYFGSGNQALMTIENSSTTSEKEIVIVKDSFANCFIPFIIDDYKVIHIIDPRYYRPHISDYIKQHENVDEVLLLYNIDSFNTNDGIVKIK